MDLLINIIADICDLIYFIDAFKMSSKTLGRGPGAQYIKETMRRMKQSLKDSGSLGQIGFTAATTTDTVSTSTYGVEPLTWFGTGTDVNSRLKDSVTLKRISGTVEFYPTTTATLPSGSVVRVVVLRSDVPCDKNTNSVPEPQDVFAFATPSALTPYNPIFVGKNSNHSFKVLFDKQMVLGATYQTPTTGTPSWGNGEPTALIHFDLETQSQCTWQGTSAAGTDAQKGHIFVYLFSDSSVNVDAYMEYCVTFSQD